MSYGRGYQDMLSLRDAMGRLFEDSFVRPAVRGAEPGDGHPQSVPVNVYHAGDNVVLFAPMPGLKPDDVEISVNEGVLTLHGNKRGNEQRHDFLLHEWTVGPYHRSVQLPDDVDLESARASLDNGVLVVTFNKSERSRPRRIHVHGAAAEKLGERQT